ncbi:MAG: restriction endonuclease [Eubacterium sp.]|nr:restriction endonuclease [Eubacterium sp.]
MKKVILFVLSILSFVLLYFSFIKLTNVDNSNKALYIVSSIVLIILALFLNTHAYLNLKNKTNYIWIAISSIVIIIYNIKEHPFWSILFTIILIIVSSILIIDRETLLAYNLSVEALKDVDKMNGYEFEQFTGKLLKNIGYENVVVTPKSNDYGIDVTCNKDGKKFAIQCKCYSSKLGNSPVQEAVAGKQYYKCDVGVVLTNNYFTENAKELANANGILLWDRTELAKMLQLEKSLLQNNTPLTNQDSKETYSEYDNSNLTVSPFTGLPNLIEINDITYNIENLDDLALLPQFPDSFSYNNETLYIHTYLRRCAEGYNKNGMTDIANALYAKAEEFEKNSISNFPKTILDEIDDANKRKNQNIEETKQEKPRKHIEKFNITQEKMNRSLDNYKIPNIDLFNYTHSDNQNTIRIYDLLDTIEFISNKFNVCLGKDYDENNIYYDLIKYPHLLISGETGTGKSICMHSIIASILFETKPDESSFF